MKYILFGLIVMFHVGLVSCQESTVPKEVSEAFKAQYPGENDPDWEIDAHGNWESHFKIKGIKYRADYAPDGSWIETESSIDKKELPKAIKEAIKRDYDDLKISEIEFVTSATKGTFYDVEFKQKGKNKDVEYREDGTELNN